jgi:dTDP-4-amino-4,6-dideoxygalactose transaminase
LNRVPFTDLAWQWRQIEAAIVPQLRELFAASAFCLGPYVEAFERAFAEYCGVAHAVGVNNGTSALHLALIAAGVRPGDKVLVPASTFIATAWAVLYVGATPVFCDVEDASANLSVADAERRIDAAVRAIIPVHLYGQPADLGPILDFAERHGLVVIEDAAQAHGARYRGRRTGGFGRVAGFSFYPGKNLGAAGEAGIVTTNDATAARRVASLRNHAQTERYIHDELGFNYRMEGIQALVLAEKLKHHETWTTMRKEIARRYLAGLANLPLSLPHATGEDHVYHLFVVRTRHRNRLRQHLERHGIQTGLHYPVPLHRQPCFAHLPIDRNTYPVADRWAAEGLSLPIFPGMSEAQVAAVIDATRSFFESARPAVAAAVC